jgi:hypothetical protein
MARSSGQDIMRIDSGALDALVLIVATAAVTGCRGTGRLADYDFRDHTVAVAWDYAPAPEILTGPWFPDVSRNPLAAAIEVGSRVAREVEASQARARLDSAVAGVDLTARMADRTLERSARLLRMRPVDDDADAEFIVEIVVRKHGIDAKDWNAAAHFFVEAEVFLIDAFDGTQIWRTKVKERDPIMPAIFGPGTVVRDVVTAAALANLSVEEMQYALERLADYSADRITARLRDALDKVQRGD